MSHHPVTTAYSLETLERHSLLYRIGADVRQADTAEAATHYAIRYFRANQSSGIIRLQPSEQYLGVLSAPANVDDVLYQDTAGQMSPVAAGPAVGRAISSGVLGDEIEYIYEPAAGSGATGLTQEQVEALIGPPEDFRFTQSTPATNWNVVHGFGDRVESIAVFVGAAGSEQPTKTGWTNVDANTVEITFAIAQQGYAILERPDV